MTTVTRRRVELLPDPPARDAEYTLISVDDHLVEPPDMFVGRLPRKFADRAPRVFPQPDGTDPWFYEGTLMPQTGANAVVGQAQHGEMSDPLSFRDMRPGCHSVHDRIKDMDINGQWGSVNFPSILSGFCGRIFSRSKDPELGLAVTRAWNDWMAEAWHGAYPDRLVPMGITWLTDAQIGADEIRRNAARGFTAVTLPELPWRLGLPSLSSGYWDPILRACEETETVIALHVGSSGPQSYAADSDPGLRVILFPVSSLQAAADWVWSGVALRFAGLKIVMAEGGIGWVPMLIDRMDYVIAHEGGPSMGASAWKELGEKELSPSDVLRRNFYFALLSDPATLEIRDSIGVDHIMVEVDYPHADSTWPDSQTHFGKLLGHLPVEDIRKMTHENAARLFRTPLPSHVRP